MIVNIEYIDGTTEQVETKSDRSTLFYQINQIFQIDTIDGMKYIPVGFVKSIQEYEVS